MEQTKPLSSYQPEERGTRLLLRNEMHTVLLHDSQELDDDLGGRADKNLAFARLLGVVDGIERIVEDGGLDHFGGRRFSMAVGNRGIYYGHMVSLQKPKRKRVPPVSDMRGLQRLSQKRAVSHALIGARRVRLMAF